MPCFNKKRPHCCVIFQGHFLQFAISANWRQLYPHKSGIIHPNDSKFGTKLKKDMLYLTMKRFFWYLSYFLNYMQVFADWLRTGCHGNRGKIRLHYSMRNLILHNIWKFHSNKCMYHKVTWVELSDYFVLKSMGKFTVEFHYLWALNVKIAKIMSKYVA